MRMNYSKDSLESTLTKLRSATQFYEELLKSYENGDTEKLSNITEVNAERIQLTELIAALSFDPLTGLISRDALSGQIAEAKAKDTDHFVSGEYAVVYFDLVLFKIINELFGTDKGNELLIYISKVILEELGTNGVACRVDSDRFMFFTHTGESEIYKLVDRIFLRISEFDIPYQIICNAGIYITNGEEVSPDIMIDRAILAQSIIKGSYTNRYILYTDSLRKDILTEQEITSDMVSAIDGHQFVAFFQPQYNHSSGVLVGAEALVRWIHPARGLISPNVFIPIFEKNGFITRLDLYVFEEACRFQADCARKGRPLIPISTNFSRNDIFIPDFAGKLEAIRTKYKVPAKLLRIEITESAIIGSSENINEIIRSLHDCGYIVEMDDFGSGYSSLNVLKDIDLDMIKLDLKFLTSEEDNKRGGMILSSVVRMATLLNLPVIAEGVETREQADFLKSIGCDYIQGFLYSRPVPEEKYIELLEGTSFGMTIPEMHLMETLDACNFWSPDNMETLIFSSLIGPAAIYEFRKDNIELIRINSKYIKELGFDTTEKELIGMNPLTLLTDDDKKAFLVTINKAIESCEEEEIEHWRDYNQICNSGKKISLKSSIRVIGRRDDSYLVYAQVRNTTREKE